MHYTSCILHPESNMQRKVITSLLKGILLQYPSNELNLVAYVKDQHATNGVSINQP